MVVGELIGLELDRCWPPWGCFEGGLSEAEVGASKRAGWAEDEKVRRRYGIDCSVRPQLLEESRRHIVLTGSLAFLSLSMQYCMIGTLKLELLVTLDTLLMPMFKRRLVAHCVYYSLLSKLGILIGKSIGTAGDVEYVFTLVTHGLLI